jgi:hypothetical protein
MKNYKENLILIIGMMIILGTHLVSCCKEPLPPVIEPEELEPTLELSITPEGVIPYGGERVVLGWTTTNATQVRVNDQRQISVKSGTKTIVERLFKDTTFYVKAINIKKFVEKEVTIPVGDWTTSTFGLVSYYPKRYKALGVSSMNGEILDYWIPDPELLSWIFYYHRDGRLTFSPNLSSKTESWYIEDKNTIVVNGSTHKLQVNQEEMIISYEVTYNGQPAWFDMYFENASDVPTDPD